MPAEPVGLELNMGRVMIQTAPSHFGSTMDLYHNMGDNGVRLWEYDNNGSGAQQFAIEHVGGGWHKVSGWCACQLPVRLCPTL